MAIEGLSLNFYDKHGDTKPRGSSIPDVSDCSVTEGMHRAEHMITLERRGHATLPDLDDDGCSKLRFKDEAARDRFSAALQNLAAGRDWWHGLSEGVPPAPRAATAEPFADGLTASGSSETEEARRSSLTIVKAQHEELSRSKGTMERQLAKLAREKSALAREKSAHRERADAATSQLSQETHTEAERALQADRWMHPGTIVEIQGHSGVYVAYKRNRKGANKHTIKFNDTGKEETRQLRDLKFPEEKSIVADHILQGELLRLEEAEQEAAARHPGGRPPSPMMRLNSKTRTRLQTGIAAKESKSYPSPKSSTKGTRSEDADESLSEQLHVKALFTSLDQVQHYRGDGDAVTAPNDLDTVATLVFEELPGVIQDLASSRAAAEDTEAQLHQLQTTLRAASADQEQIERLVPERNEARRKFLECVHKFGAGVDEVQPAADEMESFVEKLQAALPAPEPEFEPEPEPEPSGAGLRPQTGKFTSALPLLVIAAAMLKNCL